jgi:hypothetical protein
MSQQGFCKIRLDKHILIMLKETNINLQLSGRKTVQEKRVIQNFLF